MGNIGVIPLYKREQWARWQKLCGDMSSSFDVWLQHHRQMLENFESRGITVHEVEVDIDAYITWIGVERLPVDRDTRMRFAIDTFKSRHDDHSKN